MLQLKIGNINSWLIAGFVVVNASCASEFAISTDFLPAEIQWQIKNSPNGAASEVEASAYVDSHELSGLTRRLKILLGEQGFMECRNAGAEPELLVSRSSNLIALIRGDGPQASSPNGKAQLTVVVSRYIGGTSDQANLRQMCPEWDESRAKGSGLGK